jgi:WG containing repeat
MLLTSSIYIENNQQGGILKILVTIGLLSELLLLSVPAIQAESPIPFGYKSQWGFINRSGAFIIGPKYDYAEKFDGDFGKAGYYRTEKKTRGSVTIYQDLYVDRHGNEFPSKPSSFENKKLTRRSSNGLWGFINSAGEFVIPPKYLDTNDFSEGFAAVLEKTELGNRWIFICPDGKQGISTAFKEFKPGNQDSTVKSGHSLSSKNKVMSYENTPALAAYRFQEGVTVVRINQMFALIDKKGQLVVQPKYERLRLPSEGLVGYRAAGQWGFLRRDGSCAVKAKYDEIRDFHEGRAAVRINGLWGFIDKTGDLIIKPVFPFVHDYFAGFAAVEAPQTPRKWYYVDKFGKKICDPQFEFADDFHEGLAHVSGPVNGLRRSGFIDETGRIVIPCELRAAGDFANGLAPACQNRRELDDEERRGWPN